MPCDRGNWKVLTHLFPLPRYCGDPGFSSNSPSTANGIATESPGPRLLALLKTPALRGALALIISAIMAGAGLCSGP